MHKGSLNNLMSMKMLRTAEGARERRYSITSYAMWYEMVLNGLSFMLHNQQILIQLSQNTQAFMFLDVSQTNRYDVSILSPLTFDILTFEMWCPFIIFGICSLDLV